MLNNPTTIPPLLLKLYYNSKAQIIHNTLPTLLPIPQQQIHNFIQLLKTTIFTQLTTHKPPKTSTIHRKNIKYLNQLQKDKIITITKSDKTSQLTILDFSTYHEQAINHLNNTQYYQPTNLTNTQIYNTIIEQFKTIQFTITTSNFKDKKLLITIIKPNKTNTTYLPHIYFTAKTHKSPISYRPIVSGKQWITQPAATLLDQQLNNIIKNHYTYIPKDSFDFLHKLQHIQPKLLTIDNTNTYLVTFDITNLYTNLPQIETINRVTDLIANHTTSFNDTTLLPQTYHLIAKWILQNNYFQYNQTIYKQISGIAMGCRCGGSMANTYLLIWDQPIINHPNIIQYNRYFDDGFIIWNGPIIQLHSFMQTLNQSDPHIQITYNTDKTIQYLDIELNIIDNQIHTRPYRKSIANNFCLNPTSNHPNHTINNIPQTLLFRIFAISSNLSTYNHYKRLMISRLKASNYKQRTITPAILKFETKHQLINPTPSTYITQRSNLLNSLHQPATTDNNTINILPTPITYWPKMHLPQFSTTNWHNLFQFTHIAKHKPVKAFRQLQPIQRQLIHHKPQTQPNILNPLNTNKS